MKGWPNLNCIFTLLLLSISGILCPLQSQIPVVQLNGETDGLRITSQLATGTGEALLPPGQIWDLLNLVGLSVEHNFGFTEEYHWVGFTAENKSDASIWLIEIENPHINEIFMYMRAHHSDEWVQLDHTGRAAPFSSRRVAHFNFVLPIELDYGDQADILLVLDKRRSSISYHIKLHSVDGFNTAQQVHYAAYGIYFGMFFLVLLATAIAYLISFNRVYLSYLLYVLAVGLFVFNDTGLAQQYIYPWSDTIGRAARIVLVYAVLITFIRFAQHYFNIDRVFPIIHRLFNLTISAVFFHGAIYYFFTGWFQENATLMIVILYSLIFVTIGLAIHTVALYVKIEKQISLLFITAFSFIFAAVLVFIAQEFGLLPEFQILFTPVQIGSALEIMFLSIALAWRVRIVEKGQMSLKDRINRLKMEKLRAYIDGSEKERNRISMDLHDSIGNRLAQLKRKFSGSDAEHELNEIITDVRSISHELSPPGIELTGIRQNIKQLVRETNEVSRIEYTFQSMDLPEKLPKKLSIQLYRIVQETIQNIEKHSRADRAEIQLIGYSDELVLTIEDNGVGLSRELGTASGIGLDNIKKRVDYLGGTLDLTGMKGKGVQLLMIFPIDPESLSAGK